METLENSERHWPARRKHMFFQIFMAQHICRDAVEIHWANGNIQVIRPVRGISINGEAQGGIRPPLLGYSCFLPECQWQNHLQ